MDVRIRRLLPADAAAFHALRLEALERCPAAFGSARHEEAALTLDAVARRLEETAVFGADLDRALCGVAGFRQPALAKKRHKGELWGVYVRPGRRGAGVGTALVGAVIAHARGRVAQLHAAVVAGNLAARRLYARCGFVSYGLEPRALRLERGYVDEELLVLMLDA